MANPPRRPRIALVMAAARPGAPHLASLFASLRASLWVVLWVAPWVALGAFPCGAQEPAGGLGPDALGRLPPVAQPRWPERIPGYAELDPETGLHMTGTPQPIRIEDYVLRITGQVEKELELGYDEVRRLPRVVARPTLVCDGFFEDLASWGGASLAAILRLAGPLPGVRSITLISADGYELDVSLDRALEAESFLAYELEGRPLPVLHGFPLRAVFPGMNGFSWVKWLVGVRVGPAPPPTLNSR